MEEDNEDVLSSISDVINRASSFFGSDDLDFHTRQSRMADLMMNVAEIEYREVVSSAFHRWYFGIGSWIVLKSFHLTNTSEVSSPIKRDDRLTFLACYAAFNSFELVMEQLCNEESYRYCGSKTTIKCIREAILKCFDVTCSNIFIEKSWDAINLRNYIIKAADFAIDYLTTEAYRLDFKVEDEDHGLIFLELRGNLTGSYRTEDIFPKMQSSIKAMDDELVGLSGDVMAIKERLLSSQSKLNIIPIVGMGGIGKTTFTRKVYKDLEIMRCFHVRAWVIVSREFHEKDALLRLLECIAPLPDEVYKEETEKLAEILYRKLKGLRYFIVLDDIWSTKAWDCIKLCFPDDNNGSRIVLTSRMAEMASHVDSDQNPPHFMKFLGPKDSWDLLCKKLFGKDACPRNLINIGMQIATKCQGLPLAIEVMAGNLSNISKTKECWDDVVKKVGFPTDVTQMESLSSILSISYSDLPQHLKACFLSMVNFPKNFEIRVRKLIRLWTVMGFLPQRSPNTVKELTMEEVAMKCFENLVNRSLIMVRRKKFDGEVRSCGIHDLLWDLSMREFHKEGHYVFCSRPVCDLDSMNACNDDERNYVVSISKTLLSFDQSFETNYLVNSEGFKQLEVLHIPNKSLDHFPIHITEMVNLRSLVLNTSGNVPDSIYKLSNLEILVNRHVRAGQVLPKEIWLLARLRLLHIRFCTYLSGPLSVCFGENSESLLPNLEILYSISSSNCTKELFSNVPNLKRLGIDESGEENDTIEDELLRSALENLINLHKLEHVRLCCNLKLGRPRFFSEWCRFLPNTIKKLTLVGSNLPWSEMSGLAMLPNLEELKLKMNAFKGKKWEMEDEQFLQLKCLSLRSLDLVIWKASSDNFPKLQCLRIKYCATLYQIPKGFGEIDTLELIDIAGNQLTYTSAIGIQEEQMEAGNDKFIVKLGRAFPQFQIMGIFITLVWCAMILNIVKPKRGYRIKKLKIRPHPKTGKKKLLVSS